MSLSEREQQTLDSIKDRLAGSDPRLAALLATFTRLTAGEEMPLREKIRASSRRAARCWSGKHRHLRRDTTRWPAYRMYQRLGFRQAGLLLWLVIAIVLISVAVAVSRGSGQGGCMASWAGVCAESTPAHSSTSPAHETPTSHAPPG
jgi:hypothetical protein